MSSALLLLILLQPPPAPAWTPPPAPAFDASGERHFLRLPDGRSATIRLVTPEPPPLPPEVKLRPGDYYSEKCGVCPMCLRVAAYNRREELKNASESTPMEAVQAMLEAAELTEEDVLYDLGCGDGRIIVAAARLAACRAVGLDVERAMVSAAQANVDRNGATRLCRVYEQDITRCEYPEATIVTVYLYPDLLARLRPRLEKLPAGTRVVSYAHAVPGWPSQPWREVDGVSIYRWRIGTKTERWYGCSGGRCGWQTRTVPTMEAW